MATSDDELELKAAADRLIQRDLADYQGPTGDDTDMRSGIMLARAWLAEHDETPLTEDWLSAVLLYSPKMEGYVLRDDENSPIVLDLTGPSDGPWCSVWVDHGDASSPIAHPQTRGDLRRLCAALGIPLKETPQ